MDQELSKQQRIADKSIGEDEDEKRPNEKKKRIKKEKSSNQGGEVNGSRGSKKNQTQNTYNQIVAIKRGQQNTMTNQDIMNQLSSIQIPEQLKLFFMKELRQTVPICKEILPSHKFLLFGEIPLDLDFFINKMKIRKLDQNGSIFDKFRSIQRFVSYKNRIEFDLDSSYQGLSDFQYIIEALRSMNNNVAFQFAQSLQEYQNSVRYILARNEYYKKYLTQQNFEVDINQRIKKSLARASEILDSLDSDNEIFIYNIISKQFSGLVTLKKGFSKGLIKNLGVSDEEFIRSVQENKVFHSLVDQVNHASIIYSQSKMEENPYQKLRAMEVIKSIHPDIEHHHSNQFQHILRNLVKEAIKKQDVIEQFLSTQQEDMVDEDPQDFIPNPLPTFQQYQKFIKNINLHPQRFKFPPHKQIELFQNITQVLTKKQQNKLQFQQNLQRITQGNSIMSDDESSLINKPSLDQSRQFSNQEMQVENTFDAPSQSEAEYSQQPIIFENCKEAQDGIYSYGTSQSLKNRKGSMSQNQSVVDLFKNDDFDDNASITSRSNLFPLLKSISLNQQLGSVSQGMLNTLFNEYNNFQRKSVVGNNEDSYKFDDDMSSSMFQDQSFFRSFDENQSLQKQQNLLQPSEQLGQGQMQNENDLAQSVNLDQQSLGRKYEDQKMQLKKHPSVEEPESQSMSNMSKSSSSNISSNFDNKLYSQLNPHSQEHDHKHNHKHYHHFRHKKLDKESSMSSEKDTPKENKIKDFYEQLLQYIGNDEEEDGLFPFPHINSTFKEDIIKEYEQIRSMLEDGKYMAREEFNKFIDDISKQPRIKKKQYLKHLMKIPDYYDYDMKERRKKEEKERRKNFEKQSQANINGGSSSSNNNNNLNQSLNLSQSISSPSPLPPANNTLNDNLNLFQFPKSSSNQIPNPEQNGNNYKMQPPNNSQTPNFNGQQMSQSSQNFGGMFDFSSIRQNSSQSENSQQFNNAQSNQGQHYPPPPPPHHHHDHFRSPPHHDRSHPPPPHHHCHPPPPPPSFDYDHNCPECKQQSQVNLLTINNNNEEGDSPNPAQPSQPNSNHHHHHHHHPPLSHIIFPFKPHQFHHPPPPPLPHPMHLISLIREYFQAQSITDESELLQVIKNTLQDAVNSGQLNKKFGDFLSLENNIDKASEVINHIITDKNAFQNLNDGNRFPHPPPPYPHHPYHHHFHHHPPPPPNHSHSPPPHHQHQHSRSHSHSPQHHHSGSPPHHSHSPPPHFSHDPSKQNPCPFPPHPHHEHHSHHNPHRRQDQVIKKIYELNTNLSLDEEVQINDYLEIFYIGKTKLWKSFSKDFILNNTIRDVEDEIKGLQKNQLLQKYYPTQSTQIQTDLEKTQNSMFQKLNNQNGESNSQSNSPSSKALSTENRSSLSSKDEGSLKRINKDLLQKIINQFKMGPPHPFKILLLLKKAIQKIVQHIPNQYLTQPFLKNSLKMLVYLIQGDIENFIQCRERIPLEIIESMEKRVLRKFCKIAVI